MQVTHSTVAPQPNNPEDTVSSNAWNASHSVTGTANTLAGYSATGASQDVTVGSGLTLSGNTLTASGSGVTSVGLSMPAEFSVSGSPVTSSGTLAVSKANQSANQIYAGPASGSAAAPGFRALAAADLPNPSTSSIGGVQAVNAVSHQWINAINTSGVPQLSQPASSDLSDYGSVPNAALANASVTVTAGTGMSGGGAVSLGSSVTLNISTPVTVANGGTGDTGTAWTPYTPTITAQSGTFTSASATGRYKTIGKTCFIELTITITTVGSASGAIAATLPSGITAQSNAVLHGRDNGFSGYVIQGLILASATSITNILTYSNSSDIGAGASIILSGVFETQ